MPSAVCPPGSPSVPHALELFLGVCSLFIRGEAEVSRKASPTVAPQSVQCELRIFPQVWSFLTQLRPPLLYSLPTLPPHPLPPYLHL